MLASFCEALSLFVKDELRVGAARFVRADQNEVHVREDAEAPVPAELALQLVPEIRRLVVQKLHVHPVREPVLEVDIAPDERVQFLNLRQAFDVKAVDLVDQLLLERLELSVVAEFLVTLPIVL